MKVVQLVPESELDFGASDFLPSAFFYSFTLHFYPPAGRHKNWPSFGRDVWIFIIDVFTQGVSLTAQRAAIVVGVELPVYDLTKKHLILSGLMGDTVYTHFLYVYGFFFN